VGAGQQYTTATMLRMEREIIGHMLEGNRRGYNDPTLVPAHIRVETEDRHRELNAGQRQAVEEVFLSREKIVGLDGIAGAGKTTTLGVVDGQCVLTLPMRCPLQFSGQGRWHKG